MIIPFYVDGESYAPLSDRVPAMTSAPILGGDPNGTSFKGEMDELQISKTGRAPGLIKFIATNQGAGDSSKLLTIGESERTSRWCSGGYFGVILKSVTPDGWVVMGSLILTAACS